jgi:hypothetical protein
MEEVNKALENKIEIFTGNSKFARMMFDAVSRYDRVIAIQNEIIDAHTRLIKADKELDKVTNKLLSQQDDIIEKLQMQLVKLSNDAETKSRTN